MLKHVQGYTASGRVKTNSRAHDLIPSLQKYSSKMQTTRFFFFRCKMLELLYTGDGINILFLWPNSPTCSHFILSQCYFVPPVARAWLGAGDHMCTPPPVPAFGQPTGQHGRLPVKVRHRQRQHLPTDYFLWFSRCWQAASVCWFVCRKFNYLNSISSWQRGAPESYRCFLTRTRHRLH